MRFGSPRRASWLGAIHARRAQSQHPGPILLSHSLFTIPLRLSPTSYPTLSPHAAALQPKPFLLLRLRVPYHARNSSCAALAGTRTAGHRVASFCGTRTPGVLPRLGLPSETRVKEEGAFALLRRSPNRDAGFCPNSCTVEEMVFGELARLDFSGAAWRGVARCWVDFFRW